MYEPVKETIIEAHKRIIGQIHRTPVFTSSTLNAVTNCKLFFKCENMQKVGAFKFRGASNAVLQLTVEETAHGVATHSSGNHAAALSLAARYRNIPAYIIMPRTAPRAKVASVERYGGIITFCEPNLAAREQALQQVVAQTSARFIPPYNDYAVIAGQATAAKELLEEVPDLDAVIAPVGGGGLLSGTSLSVKYFGTGKTYGAEPEGADDAFRSFRDGVLYPSVHPNTIADGLLTSLGEKTFSIISAHVADIFTVSEEEIITAMKEIWSILKIIIEPSSAVPFAAVKKNRLLFKDKKVGIILSGGNLDLDSWNWNY